MSAAGGGGERELLQLRFHFGERDRDERDGRDGGPLEAAVMDACARRGIVAAVTLRGVEGFGAKHRLRTDRLLSLSEDAPLVVMAVGEREVVEGLADEVRGMARDGLLVTSPTGIATTSAAMAAMPVGADGSGAAGSAGGAPGGNQEAVRATVWGPRSGSASPHVATVAALRRHGADAATVLLGVDGMLDGERRRARFFASNRGVPAITVAIGERSAIAAALADLDTAPSLVTLEPVESSSRIAGATLHGWGVEQNSVRARGSLHARVTFVTSEIATHEGRPRYLALIHALREGGAAGSTAFRGVWGFRSDREPHGDRVLALRRDVPLLVETVDTAERAERWEELALSLAGDEDVVYSQSIPRVTTLG